MPGYTKLFASIVHSTVWRSPDHVRLVWVTMLALAEKDGTVEVSVPGLADAARVTPEECADALEYLQQPDPWSRTKAHDGRRIEPIDGGWLLLNHDKYRKKLAVEDRRQKDSDRQQRLRDRRRVTLQGVTECDNPQSRSESRQAEAEAAPEAEAEAAPEGGHAPSPYSVPADWSPDAAHRGRCAELGIDLDAEEAAFRLYDFPRPVFDWNKRFSLWLMRAKTRRESLPRGLQGAATALDRQAERIRLLRAEEGAT